MNTQDGDHFAHPIDDPLDPAFVAPHAPRSEPTRNVDPFRVMARVTAAIERQRARYDPRAGSKVGRLRDRTFTADEIGDAQASEWHVGYGAGFANARARAALGEFTDARRAIIGGRIVIMDARSAYPASMTGIPPRTYRDEDRAQEARYGARVMRRTGWHRMIGATGGDRLSVGAVAALVRTFVPRTRYGEARSIRFDR